ncbi:hypothetical protein [Arthrobacter sp. 31Y]|uniref:hypothetical protein n=1 Tax=Arthrobacter sp. 31Y TaxID=1115632 RepID=UPI0016398D59|nr:hypothetical protein [Arthrobacter sp. 31Y]
MSGTSERAWRYQSQYGTQDNHCRWHDAQNDQGYEIRGSAPFAPLQLGNGDRRQKEWQVNQSEKDSGIEKIAFIAA